MITKLLPVFIILSFVSVRAFAEPEISFNRDIRPILADKCFPCHGRDKNKREAKLRLDLREAATLERDGNRVIAPGKPTESQLIRRINHVDPEQRMPPQDFDRSTTAEQRRLLEAWIAAGAKYQPHWAFISPRREALPKVSDDNWPKNAIDYFSLARLDREGLTPSPSASRERLLRRLSFDLTGLPPKLAELEAFLADTSPQAVERVIDKLLARDSYGEHMAVSWLDAARYADTNGYNNDTPRYNWRWRDWVIEAFNRNLPFDQFLTEQLAGDLIPQATVEQQLATGFNRNHSVTSEGGIIDEEYRLEYVADRVNTTATVFMGLSLRCARCHDHKFDPVSQKEYYAFSAFFNQVPETGYHKEHVGNPKPVIQAPTPEQNVAMEQLTLKLKTLNAKIESRDQLDDSMRAALVAEKDQTQKALEELKKGIATAMIMRDQPQLRPTFVLMRGDYNKPGDQVSAATPAVFPPFPEAAPRNRLGLARWLSDARHPLTARVAVNRLWYQMFGIGIVETQEDFGTQGAWPSHPELLDWLAVEYVESGWDTKALLKLIALSSTYQQMPRGTSELRAVDPQNRLLARGPRSRLSAEMIRDNALAISGLLTRKVGGPSVRPYQPLGLWTEVIVADDSYSGGKYVQDRGQDLYRRGVYTWWKRTCPPPALNTFDAPDREFCLVRRTTTNTPLQALVMLNDPTLVEAARGLAQRILTEVDAAPESRASFAFRLATSRSPRPNELKILVDTYERQRSRFAANEKGAIQLLAVGDSDPSPALDKVELAAWTTVASMILNLDEAITR